MAGIIGALALVIFVRRQRRSTTPMIDLALFKNPPFRLGVVVALVSAFSIVGLELALSQRLQLVLGYSPLQAATFVLPASLLAFIGGPLAGWLSHQHGTARVMAVGLFLGGLGVVGLFLSAGAGPLPQLLAMAIFGLGLGSSFAVASHTIMNEAPPERAGMAASIEEVAFELGGAIGITILGTLLAGVYSALFVIPKGAEVPASVVNGIDHALKAAETLPADIVKLLTEAVHGAFDTALFGDPGGRRRRIDRRCLHGVAREPSDARAPLNATTVYSAASGAGVWISFRVSFGHHLSSYSLKRWRSFGATSLAKRVVL